MADRHHTKRELASVSFREWMAFERRCLGQAKKRAFADPWTGFGRKLAVISSIALAIALLVGVGFVWHKASVGNFALSQVSGALWFIAIDAVALVVSLLYFLARAPAELLKEAELDRNQLWARLNPPTGPFAIESDPVYMQSVGGHPIPIRLTVRYLGEGVARGCSARVVRNPQNPVSLRGEEYFQFRWLDKSANGSMIDMHAGSEYPLGIAVLKPHPQFGAVLYRDAHGETDEYGDLPRAEEPAPASGVPDKIIRRHWCIAVCASDPAARTVLCLSVFIRFLSNPRQGIHLAVRTGITDPSAPIPEFESDLDDWNSHIWPRSTEANA